MKKINNYWVDERNNKWSDYFYTEEQAQKESETLKNCSGCSGCSRCSDCSGCSDFIENPERITSKKIGSRNSQSTFYWTKDKEQMICGSFKGTLNEFQERVIQTHKENIYAIEYLNWIEKIKNYRS